MRKFDVVIRTTVKSVVNVAKINADRQCAYKHMYNGKHKQTQTHTQHAQHVRHARTSEKTEITKKKTNSKEKPIMKSMCLEAQVEFSSVEFRIRSENILAASNVQVAMTDFWT